jgi:hypothetical protein
MKGGEKIIFSQTVELAGFKQTYWSGHLSEYAEPALGFPSTQSPQAAIKILGGSTVGKLVLCTVPTTAPKRGTNKRNEYAGKMYAVVELFAVACKTERILEGYPAPANVVEFWINQWPQCLPIRRWYDLRNARYFSEIHPDASREAQIARGKLRVTSWLTDAAALKPDDLVERDVYITPALQEIHSMLEHRSLE